MNCASHVTMESVESRERKKRRKKARIKTLIAQLNEFVWFVRLRIFELVPSLILWNHFFVVSFFLFLVNLLLDVIQS